MGLPIGSVQGWVWVGSRVGSGLGCVRVPGRVRPGTIVLVGVSSTYRWHLSTASCMWSGLLDVLLLVEGSL